MKPFDFVRPRREFLEKRYHGGGCRLRFIADSGKPGRTITNEDRIKAVGIITETCGESANVEWIGDNYGLYSAWWGAENWRLLTICLVSLLMLWRIRSGIIKNKEMNSSP